jgi:hypothetical protein
MNNPPRPACDLDRWEDRSGFEDFPAPPLVRFVTQGLFSYILNSLC